MISKSVALTSLSSPALQQRRLVLSVPRQCVSNGQTDGRTLGQTQGWRVRWYVPHPTDGVWQRINNVIFGILFIKL